MDGRKPVTPEDDVAVPEDVTGAESRPEGRDERRTLGMSRRSFLAGAVGLAAGAVLFGGQHGFAHTTYRAYERLDNLTDEQLVEMYRRMLTTRWTEVALKNMFLAGHDDLYRPYIFGIGQEGVGTGVGMTLRNDLDWVFATHRPGHTFLGRGIDPKKLVAENFFRMAGYTHGHGNTMHMIDAENHTGSFSIVGASLYPGAGAGWAAKVNKTGGVGVSVFGDGATHSAYLASTLQWVSTFNIPWIGILENNGWGSGMRTEQVNPPDIESLAQRAGGYGVPFEVVDGMDVLKVYAAAKRAVDRARAGEGPTLIECKCARFMAHSGTSGIEAGDAFVAWDDPMRSAREMRAWAARDPLPKHRQVLIGLGVLTEEQADEMVLAAKRQGEEAIALALESPHTQPEDGMRQVFADYVAAPTQFIRHRAWS